MGYASDRRERKRAKRQQNMGLVTGALAGILRGLLQEKQHSDVMAVKQAQLALDTESEHAKLGMEREKLDVSRQRAATYEKDKSSRALIDLLKAKGSAGGFKPTAAQMERAAAAIHSTGAKTPEDALKAFDAEEAGAAQKQAGMSFIDKLLNSGKESEAKKGRDSARAVLQLAPGAAAGMFPQGAAPAPVDQEGQDLQSLSDAYMTAIQGRPGDPAAMAAWGKIGQVFPQLVPAWVKAQAMGGPQLPPPTFGPESDPKLRALEASGRAMWYAPR